MSTNGENLAAVKRWLLARKPQLGDIDLDLDLIENRIIDSLGFVDFLFFLEQLAGRELPTDAQSIKAYRTLRSLRDNVLGPASASL
jgi:acyl carrier protein